MYTTRSYTLLLSILFFKLSKFLIRFSISARWYSSSSASFKRTLKQSSWTNFYVTIPERHLYHSPHQWLQSLTVNCRPYFVIVSFKNFDACSLLLFAMFIACLCFLSRSRNAVMWSLQQIMNQNIVNTTLKPVNKTHFHAVYFHTIIEGILLGYWLHSFLWEPIKKYAQAHEIFCQLFCGLNMFLACSYHALLSKV